MFQRIICQAPELPEMTIQTNLEKEWALGWAVLPIPESWGWWWREAWQECSTQGLALLRIEQRKPVHSTGWRWFWNQRRRSQVPHPEELGRRWTTSFWGFAAESGLDWKVDWLKGRGPIYPGWSIRDQIYFPTWYSPKADKTMLLKTLVMRQRREVILDGQETGAVRPPLAPSFCLERVSRLQSRAGDPGRAWHILSRRNRAGSPGVRGSQGL